MITLNATQQAIVASDYKLVSWLFDITTVAPVSYRWSTKNKNYGGHDYTYKVSDFDNITLTKTNSEHGIQSPNDLIFTIVNKDNVLSADDFVDAYVLLRLVVSDGTDEEVIRTWKFKIKQSEPHNQTIKFTCVDFIQDHLVGDYPNTKLFKDISPSDDGTPDDTLCVPLPFGTCYIPLRSIYITDARYYVLGLASHTYTITKVRSPHGWGNTSEWDSGSYTFTQSTKTIGGVNWRVFQPIIADSNNDGTCDACGLWKSGDIFLDPLVQLSRNDTSSVTSPADIIEFVLKDMGVASADIDATTFGTAKATYTSWGLTFNGAYFYKIPREQALAMLLNMCHSVLLPREKLELHVLSKTSQWTLNKSHILQRGKGESSFDYNLITQEKSDSGYIGYQVVDTPQDNLVKAIVPAKATTDEILNETLDVSWINDSQDAQRAGSLYYQRKLLKKSNNYFNSKGTLLALDPDDMITIDHANYGGTYNILIDTITINRDVVISFNCTRYTDDLDDWTNLTPGAINIATDDSTDFWSVAVNGPDSTVSSGIPPTSGTAIGIQGWQHDIVFSSTDADTVSWASGTIILMSGTTYNIVAGNTGNMAAYTHMYLDVGVSTTIIQTTTTASNAVGANKILIGIAKNSTNQATFQIFGGIGGLVITGGDIENLTITAGEIAAAAIETAKLAADAVTAAKIAVAGLDGTSGDVAANHIIANMLQTDCVTSAKVLADAITAPKINVVGLDGTSGRIVVADATDANVVTGGINSHAVTLINAGKILISGAAVLSDWSHATDATLIDGGEIYTNSITASQIAANTITANEIAANTITAGEIDAGTITLTEMSYVPYVIATDDLDDISDGTNYSKVATTSITAGQIVLTAGVTGSLPVANSDAKCTDANADQTSINTAAGINSVDVRDDNEPPSFYYSKGFGIYTEFKTRTIIGAPGSAVHGSLKSSVPWNDTSGGPIVQQYYEGPNVSKRYSTSTSTWGGWTTVTDWADQTSANTAANAAAYTGAAIGTGYTDADVTDYADYRVSNSQLENTVTTISNPQGGTYSGGDNDTGAIVITLPQSWTNTMLKFEVDVFNHSASKSFKALVGGYIRSSISSWDMEFAQIVGNTQGNNRVRFGHDGTKCCVVIGETSTVWRYLKIAVRNFQGGYNNYSIAQWDDGWSISTETDISGITFTGDFSDALLDSASILNQGVLATEDDLDGVPDGTNYSKVATTSITAGQIVLTAGVTGSLPVANSDAKCTDANADQTSANTAANAAAYTGAAIGTTYTAAKCTDANADQTSANTAADAAAYTGAAITTGYTIAKCTNANADQTSINTAANAAAYTGAAIATGYTDADVTDYADYRVSNSQLENTVTTISNPQGGTYSGGDNDTGAIVITLPQSWTNTMLKFEVDVFNHSASKSFKALVGGYIRSSISSWDMEFAQIVGNTQGNNRVRFGHDGTKCCVVIGETSTVWRYLKIAVRNFQGGYNNYSIAQWDDGWSISTETDISGITFTGDFSDALLDSASILNQGVLATEDDLDGVPDGTNYSKVATTSITAGQIVLTAGVTGSLPVANSDAKCTDANADQTSINTAAGINSVDVRDDNEPPSFYYSKGFGIYTEFKTRTIIGAPGSAVHGSLKSSVPWNDTSGGPIVQQYYEGPNVSKRYSTSTSTWGGWTTVTDWADQTSANTAANAAAYTGAAIGTTYTAAKCTDANADQTSANTAANAAAYTGAAITTGYTIAKCTNANADQTSINTAANAAAYTGAAIATGYTDAKCTNVNADQTSANTAANAAAYTGSSISVSYTAAKCTNANADQTSDNGQNLGWLIGSTGSLTISSTGKLVLNTADALEIQAAGNVLVKQGGDIVMEGGASGNPSLLRFADEAVPGEIRWEQNGNSAKYWQFIKLAANDQMFIRPYGLTAPYFSIGETTNRVGAFYIHSTSACRFYVGSTINSLAIYNTSITAYVNLLPNGHKTLDIGSATAAYDIMFSDDFTNVADFYQFDDRDDLATLHQIKGSGIIDPLTGYELIDDLTLPAWLLKKHNKDGEVRDEDDIIISTYKRGDDCRDPDGRPYLSLKTMISLCMGAIREIDKKIEALHV